MSPDPHALFQLTGPLAMLGWLTLALAPLAPRLADAVAALVIPILLYWSDAPGGFDSLANVMALFTDPAVALAGWVHYLAFDLFVGAWITRTARAEGISHLLILPCLALTFLFGPAGFLAFTALRASFAARARMRTARA
jgi:Domain of unknown function (DUF4281)